MALRQNAISAATVVERLGNMTEPLLREAVAAHFLIEEEQQGELSIDFLQGFFSGVHFAQTWLLKVEGPASKSAQLVSELAIEAARKYIERFEKQVNKSL
jgi:hypothetical protein